MSPPEPNTFRFVLAARAEAVAAALETLAAGLEDLGIDAGVRGDVSITMGEVLNNIVEHACVGLDAAEIVLQAGFAETELWIRVYDPGRPFEGDTLPEGREVDLALPVETLPEGGFGWFLIRSLTSGIDYHRGNGLNCLTLRFAL